MTTKATLSLLKEIPSPQNYFAGTPPLTCEMPKNVLVFTRLHSRELGTLPAKNPGYFHHRYVLVLDLAGDGDVMVDNHLLRIRPGQAILIFPHQFHHHIDMKPCMLRWLFITFEADSEEYLKELRNLSVPLSRLAHAHIANMVRYYAAIAGPAECVINRIVLTTALLLNELVATARQESASHKAKTIVAKDSLPELILRINTYIYRNIDRKMTTVDLARHFAKSPSHLRGLYRQATGLTIGAYIKELQIRRATMLLERSGMNISQIANECGFSSVFTFSRAFKKRLEVSPLRYRRRRRSP